MVERKDLVEGKEYKVVANVAGHEFRIGEIVRFKASDPEDDDYYICEHLDGSDYWFMALEELAEVEE